MILEEAEEKKMYCGRLTMINWGRLELFQGKRAIEHEEGDD